MAIVIMSALSLFRKECPASTITELIITCQLEVQPCGSRTKAAQPCQLGHGVCNLVDHGKRYSPNLVGQEELSAQPSRSCHIGGF
jgi:hypothetical protein